MTSTRARSGPCAIGAASASRPASWQARQARMRARSASIVSGSSMALWFHILPAAVYGRIRPLPLSATISYETLRGSFGTPDPWWGSATLTMDRNPLLTNEGQRPMEVRVEQGSLTETETPLLVVNLFKDADGLGGATGAVDQAMGGLLSRLR